MSGTHIGTLHHLRLWVKIVEGNLGDMLQLKTKFSLGPVVCVGQEGQGSRNLKTMNMKCAQRLQQLLSYKRS